MAAMAASAPTDLRSIALLIDQLKHDDLSLRVNSTRALVAIATALGPDRTRNELIPFLCESTDDEDENEERQRNKHMPDWARGAALREALKGQRDADPAQVFQIGGSTCELAAIFKTDRAFKKRTSSQNWGADLASQHEQQRYKQDMGFQSPPRGPF